MNPTILIRCVAATLAATTLLAQSAPAPAAREKRTAEKAAEAKATDRMQVRLAEVIAMLEEDDLGPDERAKAKAKLEEIVAKLREQRMTPAAPRATSATPSAPATPPAPTAGPSGPNRRRVAALSPDSSEAVIVETPTAIVKAPRSAVVTEDGRKFEIVQQDPQPAKAPKAPSAPKAPAPPTEAQDPAPAPKVLIERDGKLEEAKVRADGDVYTLKLDAEKARAGALRLRAAAEKMEADGEAMRGKLRTLAERAKDAEEGATRAQARAKKALAEVEADSHARDKAEVRVLRAAEAKRAHDEAMEHHERAHADAVRAQDKARAYVLQERERLDAERARVRVRAGGEDAKKPAAPARTRVLKLDDVTGGEHDDDRRIEKLIQEMRAEMREIRKLVEQLRKQVTAAPRASSNNRYGPTTSPALLPFSGTVGTLPDSSTVYRWRTDEPQPRKASGQGKSDTKAAPKKRASGTGSSGGSFEPLRVQWQGGSSGFGGNSGFAPLQGQWRTEGASGFGGTSSARGDGDAQGRYGAGSSTSQMR